MQTYVNPYTYTDKNGKKIYSYDLLKKYKPIISITKENDNKKIIIYEPGTNNILITITKDNPVYRWMFTYAFEPTGNTNYVALNYSKLANSKEIEYPNY